MNILATGLREPFIFTDVLRRLHHSVEFIPIGRLVDAMKDSPRSGLATEAVVGVAHPNGSPPFVLDEYVYTEVSSVLGLVRDIRALPPYCAMRDGRKWSAVPIVIIVNHLFSQERILESTDATILDLSEDYLQNIEDIGLIVADYKNRLLNELDNLGLLVTYDHGRYRVGPALTPRAKNVEGEFYFGPSDQRKRGKYYTLDRDNFGIQYEIEKFEALINDPGVKEGDLQKFFEENPHFLIATRLMQALPHVSLHDKDGKLLVPDFLLKPIVAFQRDSNWEVLDLKLPQAKLLAGPSNHIRFSQDVMKAINQVKDYKDYFENPMNAQTVGALLGHALKHPKLGVLIGRMPSSGEVEALEIAQSREPGVKIVTYDEILETQKKLVE